MTQSEFDALLDAVQQLGESFHAIEETVRLLPENVQRDFFNPTTLGPIAAFLCQGKGYEPAYWEGHNSEQLIAIAEDYREDSEE